MKQLKILVIDDEKLIRWSLEKHLSAKGYQAIGAESGEEGIKIFEQNHPEIVLVDNKLPGIQGLEVIKKIKSLDEEAVIVFMTAYGSIETAVEAMKSGATEYINKPFAFEEVEVILDNIKNKLKIIKEIQVLKRQQKDIVTFDHIIGESVQFKQIVHLARKIARTKTTTILLLGESGTGKDMFAHAIHNDSTRHDKPFITINCSSLPETLLESELFGHEKGAFTDAKQMKKGLFELAEGGTVFLDEIGEINAATQIKLLGVLENRVVRRIGGTQSIPVDIRIIAATNRDLKRAIDDKSFREDLYYRLKVFQIILPPLRERRDDIPLIANHFITHYNSQFQKNVSHLNEGVRAMFLEYNWPGNIRELRNVIERAVILETMTSLQPDNLPNEMIGKIEQADNSSKENYTQGNIGTSGSIVEFNIPNEGFSLYEIEKQLIIHALKKSDNNQTRTSKMLGISRDTLRYKMKKYKL
ncbi:MAG: sigma-54-dependent Fis family transcriptional regulator [Bacteroidales bacterium]|nr:sigma-54-dependent Fis family transcriptional regulator [Bacteroidales bacterium]